MLKENRSKASHTIIQNGSPHRKHHTRVGGEENKCGGMAQKRVKDKVRPGTKEEEITKRGGSKDEQKDPRGGHSPKQSRMAKEKSRTRRKT